MASSSSATGRGPNDNGEGDMGMAMYNLSEMHWQMGQEETETTIAVFRYLWNLYDPVIVTRMVDGHQVEFYWWSLNQSRHIRTLQRQARIYHEGKQVNGVMLRKDWVRDCLRIHPLDAERLRDWMLPAWDDTALWPLGHLCKGASVAHSIHQTWDAPVFPPPPIGPTATAAATAPSPGDYLQPWLSFQDTVVEGMRSPSSEVINEAEDIFENTEQMKEWPKQMAEYYSWKKTKDAEADE
ncbi:uncharacterized protein EV422DRAFT_507192 [Fimicolochytrium jonesii]|uniref:uncharacterized protein n=1 Tax=Fimicolochytrium jonesii TaxID=1396493 RepID=UPI0022FEA31B|nr:uncharacterized protein EV422DRAFT_507192 [Fimicolochytrium jonesii]KAI8819535.1 hypothetical protein EV422DRAFT_507192 [Fimicolochytrium jonesii]